MAELFRKGGSPLRSSNSIWLRNSPASTIAIDEFFGVPIVGTAGYIKFYTGSVWTLKPVKVWTGSAWVQKPVKYWSGTAWVLA